MEQDPLKNVATEHIFHFNDGKKAHNLKDLYDAIKAMSNDAFLSHVTKENNDFANWAEYVYNDQTMADDLKKVTSQKQTLEVIGAAIGRYILEDNKPEAKQPFESPASVSGPSQTITNPDGSITPTISTHAPHKFILKEFLYGTIFGASVVAILFLILRSIGVVI